MEHTIGIIGAGVMGRMVALTFAQKSYKVVIIDISERIIQQAYEEICNIIRFQSLYEKETIKAAGILGNISFSQDFNELMVCSCVVENVTEDWEIKKQVYHSIAKKLDSNCMVIVNTSCISITKIAALVPDPERVIGVHFMNPVNIIKTVEVIRGYHTSDKTVNRVRKLLTEIGKEMILIHDAPGFVSNRLSHLFMNEAAMVVQDGIASAKDVDDIFKKCYGHKMGPLETADLIGLDTVVDSLYVLYNSYQDVKFRCCPLLVKMVDAGLCGKKSGEGFYKYYSQENNN